jgi:hypothetical protein
MDNEIEKLANNMGIETASNFPLQESIRKYIAYLLDNDLNTLYSLLYRIDVSEQKAKDCFGKNNSSIAEGLSYLIIDRLKEKVESRKKYKK